MYVHVQRLSGSPIYSNSVIFSVFKKKYTYNILWDTINQNKISPTLSLCNALSDKLSLSNYYDVNGDGVSFGRYI